MCVASAITDYYMDKNWPTRNPIGPTYSPNTNPLGIGFQLGPHWDIEALSMLKDILKRLDALDAKMGEKPCIAPEKVEWLKKLEEDINHAL